MILMVLKGCALFAWSFLPTPHTFAFFLDAILERDGCAAGWRREGRGQNIFLSHCVFQRVLSFKEVGVLFKT